MCRTLQTIFRPYEPSSAERSDRSAGDRARHRAKVRESIRDNIADILSEEKQDVYVIERGAFTSCAQPNPRWGFTASSATIDIDGTGGNGTASNNGVRMRDSNTKVTSANGAIQIAGTMGASSTIAIELLTTNHIQVSGTAPVTLIGDYPNVMAVPVSSPVAGSTPPRQKLPDVPAGAASQTIAPAAGVSGLPSIAKPPVLRSL